MQRRQCYTQLLGTGIGNQAAGYPAVRNHLTPVAWRTNHCFFSPCWSFMLLVVIWLYGSYQGVKFQRRISGRGGQYLGGKICLGRGRCGRICSDGGKRICRGRDCVVCVVLNIVWRVWKKHRNLVVFFHDVNDIMSIVRCKCDVPKRSCIV